MLVFNSIPKKGNAKVCPKYCTIALISHASKVMFKILQARLQQYVNRELLDVQAGFRKGRGTRDQIANICWIIEKAENSRRTSTSALLTMPKPLTVSVQFSWSIMSDSLRYHEPQHARPPYPSPTARVYPHPCPLSRWCQPTISSSVVPFSSCPRSFPASGSFQMSQLFTSGGQSIGASASASVLPITTNCGKFWRKWEYQTTWPASWEICMQVRKQQLELDMEQQTGSK